MSIQPRKGAFTALGPQAQKQSQVFIALRKVSRVRIFLISEGRMFQRAKVRVEKAYLLVPDRWHSLADGTHNMYIYNIQYILYQFISFYILHNANETNLCLEKTSLSFMRCSSNTSSGHEIGKSSSRRLR